MMLIFQIPVPLSEEQEAEKKAKEAERKKAQRKIRKEKLKVRERNKLKKEHLFRGPIKWISLQVSSSGAERRRTQNAG